MSVVAEIKKNLKKWEIDFYSTHKKKPDTSDIANAPSEIKDLYSKYFKLKKASNTPFKKQDDQNWNDSCRELEGNTSLSRGSDDVWGTELNRTASECSHKYKSSKNNCNSGSGFLNKISDRMFQNSKLMSAKKTKGFQTKNVCSIPKMDNNDSDEAKKSEGKCTGIDQLESLSTENYEPFKEVTSVSMPTLSGSYSSFHMSSVIDPDLIIHSFGDLKNKSMTNVHSFKTSLNKIPKQSELADIPQQFCLPSKPRFSLQSREEAKQKADELKSKIYPEMFTEEVQMDAAFDSDISSLNTSLNSRVHDSICFKYDSCSKESYAPTNKTKVDNVDTLKPRHVKIKSALQEKLEKHLDNTVENTSTDNVASVSKKKLNKSKNDEAFDFKSYSDTDESPMKAKTSSKKRKPATETGNKTSNKRQKTDIPLVSNIPGGEDEEHAQRKPTVRRAAPASKKGISENFVRLNMKSKKYKRKGGGMTGGMYKRKQWKMKMQARSKSYGDKCFICDLPGHWSNNCPEKGKQNKKTQENSKPVNEDDFLSLKEAALMARGVKVNREINENEVFGKEKEEDPTVICDEVELGIEADIVRNHADVPVAPKAFDAFYNTDVFKSTDTPKDMKKALQLFGFQSFRPGQEVTMKRILCGQSTLVVLSTGEGKSLCYQLPAFVYGQKSSCLTLVVSPLVSLMEDQVTGLPPGVNGACLHANMSKVQKESVFASIAEGKVHFLLVSPEAVVGGAWSTYGSFPGPDKLPPIAFVCIDEAHCLSEWSHNFRPSYLRLCKILREVYGVKCFLGLTATATKSTAVDVAKHLGIEDDEEAIIRGSPIPKNLLLSVSRDLNKDEALINLLQGDRFSACQSIIIYCTRREQANRIATYIRTCLQKPEEYLAQKSKDKSGKKKPQWSAECYHAGLSAAQRKKVQKNFMIGKLRVVVATVAFGMGLDKSDVRAVLHYNMPKSFESYVQEIGRAGRDRQLSHCHLFLDPEGKDLNELRRHTHGNTVDRYTIRKLLQKVFMKCRCRDVHEKFLETDKNERPLEGSLLGRICRGHERALCIEDCVMSLDIREEGLYTLLCYLELHQQRWVDILSPVYSTCQIKCYGGPSQLQAVSKKCPPLAVAIAKQKIEGEYFSKSNTIEFPVVEISDSMGWDSALVKRELRQLQWGISPSTGGPIKSGVMVEFTNLSFHFRSPGDLIDNELDEILDFLYHRVTKQESNELYQLDLLSEALKSVSFKSYWMCADDGDVDRSDKLKKFIEDFFNNEKPYLKMTEKAIEMPPASLLDQLLSDVRQFFNLYGREHTLTGRAIARIFHGIGSPCFPVETWGRVRRFWRCNLHIDFNLCLKMASQELLKIR